MIIEPILNMESIYAIDPGKRTGIAYWPHYKTESVTDFAAWVSDLEDEIHKHYKSGIPRRDTSTLTVIIEDYKPYKGFNNSQNDRIVFEQHGMMKYLKKRYPMFKLIVQDPIVRRHVRKLHRDWTPRNRDEKAAAYHIEAFLLDSLYD